MTIRELFNWILDVQLSSIFIILFWLIAFIFIIRGIIYAYFGREERESLHLKMMENETYKQRYLKEKKANRIITIIFVIIFLIPFIIIIYNDTAFNNTASFFNLKNWF